VEVDELSVDRKLKQRKLENRNLRRHLRQRWWEARRSNVQTILLGAVVVLLAVIAYRI
jgi:type II secretory pathway component PulM